MPDRGHELTDKLLGELEKRITAEYRQAAREMQEKLDTYLSQMEKGRQAQKKLLDAGEITKKDYDDWCFRHMMMGKRWEEIRDTLAEDLRNVQGIARSTADGYLPDVYALNHNYSTFQVEHDGLLDTSYTLYNREAVERLMRENPKLLPDMNPKGRLAKAIAEGKAQRWNAQHIQSAVVQGILQGESIGKIASRMQRVAEMDRSAALRYARTAVTGAQNAGRHDAYERAAGLGVDLVQEWQATLDGRTRHEHRQLHGQRVAVDEPFEVDGYELRFPGDPAGPAYLVYNCRCTTLSWVKGFEGETVKSSPKMGEMTFEEWLDARPVPDTTADRNQFAEYTKLLGKDAPKYYTDFQRIKYFEPQKWGELKEAAKMERTIRAAPCQLTKKKFTGYFLRPGAKHADDFFRVGYTENDARLLKYHIARQFDMAQAVESKVSEDGIQKFNIYMELGVSETKRFCIGWQKDAPDSKPRIITGFRKDK